MKLEDKSAPQLTKYIDEKFQKWVRLRDTDENGYGVCCSCGKIISYQAGDFDAGHFVSRAKTRTRWDETNVHGQCKHCNKYEHGNLGQYALFIQKKYGQDYAQTLFDKAALNKRWERSELIELAKEYRGKVKELAKTKNFEVRI